MSKYHVREHVVVAYGSDNVPVRRVLKMRGFKIIDSVRLFGIRSASVVKFSTFKTSSGVLLLDDDDCVEFNSLNMPENSLINISFVCALSGKLVCRSRVVVTRRKKPIILCDFGSQCDSVYLHNQNNVKKIHVDGEMHVSLDRVVAITPDLTVSSKMKDDGFVKVSGRGDLLISL
ncbi:hypothetical protein [Photobacterium kishitanii]|uniref:Uncharacterized protein n=1 Tax=Photobacterium kishitanii TaxID=318456 RepID=A0A2T3KM94_9GAMM|nr:hypothetical protein [Photobacterium kishitanii]PSV00927.1 hypothetical protein C9J27_02550 [Photobacterium kishitanii]